MKTCLTCKTGKPYTEFSKNKSAKDNYQGQCKYCVKQYSITNSAKLKEYQKQYRLTNSEKSKQYMKQYFINNAEYFKQYRLDNAVKIKQYRIDNIDRFRQYEKEYGKSEHGRLIRNVKEHKNRTLKLNNTPVGKHHTPADIKLKLKLQKYKCIYCKVSIKAYYEIDHFIPISQGGSNMASNIQLLCEKCNGSGGKWDKMPHEFARKHGKLF